MKEIGMTEGMMTQSSHLMKLACKSIKTSLPDAHIDMIPGAVTAEVRKAWDVFGVFKELCPEAADPVNGRIIKEDLRSLTHLHHALDACVLGLISEIIPADRKKRVETRHYQAPSGSKDETGLPGTQEETLL